MHRFAKPGKRDRDREREYARRNRIELKPITQIEIAITNLNNQLKDHWRKIPCLEAVNMYLNARNLRHDLWLEYLNDNKSKHYYKFCDTRFGTFMRDLIQKLNLPPEFYPDLKIKDLTPDILIYDDNNKTIFLGDVSVSVVRRMSEQRKYEKYIGIKKYLEDKGFKVCHTNFIVDEELTNIDRLITQFSQIGLIKADFYNLSKIKQYHLVTNRIMLTCEEQSDDKAQFMRLLLAEDKRHEENFIDIDIPHLIDLIPESPIRTEKEIIDMIKNETDMTYETYFDKGFDNAKEEFNNLYEKFKTHKHKQAKSTLKVIHNSKFREQLSGHELLEDYIRDIPFSDDETISNYICNLLPTLDQTHLMKNADNNNVKTNTYKNAKVFGKWQYSQITKYHGNVLTMDYREKISRGKKNPNIKKEPTTIDPDTYESAVNFIDNEIYNLGSISKKESFLDNSWDAQTNAELENTNKERQIYDIVRQSQGVQLGQSLSMLYQRLTHLKTSASIKDNIFIPPNGSFIAIIPKEHQPLTNSKCDVPLIFITRSLNTDTITPGEYDLEFKTNSYHYYVSKLCRLPIDKIAHWDQAGHKITACASYLISTCSNLQNKIEETIGTICMLSLDLHQKTSELLDLLKYVSFMPFSDISRVSKLIKDKFDIMLKTKLDVWVIKKIEDFMIRLSDPRNVTGVKEKLKVFNGTVLSSTLGMNISIPGFISKDTNHKKIQHFVEEISTLNIIRGKQFYGSQFMDKSITDTAKWNEEYIKEQELYKGWTEGHDNTSYPFDAKFCFSKDAIIYALKYFEKEHPINKNKINKKLSDIDYDTFIHRVCTLRGCTKEKYQRSNNIDLHTTSLDACLNYYKTIGYDTKKANTIEFAMLYLLYEYIAQYTMSQKEQRGSGRPIATPTLKTKIGNLMIEKPEQAIGSFTKNNILVAGKHKLKQQSITYKELLEDGYAKGLKYVYQCTEDQSKFSENDNTRKYYTYIKNNNLLPNKVRQLQYKCLEKMIGREHLIKKIPKQILDDTNLTKYINQDYNGIKAIIGWPQGMLNNISTSIHSIADYWITDAFNKAYGTNIITKGLVHSDDSWYAIACNSKEEFIKFSVFRAHAKKLFCLKLNDKKLWGSKMIGELVSNFNINGEVLVPVSKTIANGFGSLLYQNWVMDVHSQISTLQQLYRQGANISIMIMLSTILRQQIISAYNLQNKLPEHFYLLPIELGGYPKCSAFELGVTGVNCHYKYIFDFILANPNHEIAKIVLTTMRLSMIYNKKREDTDITSLIQSKCKTNLTKLFEEKNIQTEADYQSIIVPKRGEVFSCIKHIMPKSKKISKTMERIKELPFETDNLEMLVTKPKDLSIALGHLKSQMNTLLFSLASEKYTGSKKRLAINQSIQATGKTVQLAGFCPMTMHELINTIKQIDGISMATVDQLEISFEDETNLVDLTNCIVYKSDLTPTTCDKRKIVNRMPDFEDKFKTICELRNVLLYTIDQIKKTNYYNEYTSKSDPIELIKTDSDLILKRFKHHFAYYNTEYACNLIMQQYFSRIQPRLWTQPELRTDDMQNFLEDMYGKSLNNEINYSVSIDFKMELVNKEENQIIQSIYTIAVLNCLYPNSFKIREINKNSVITTLENIDYAQLSQSSYLKYAILMKIYKNTNVYLSDYDNKKEYKQYYKKPQRIIQGTYKGDFVVYIKYGNLVMKVEGEPENLTITVNRAFIKEITTAMFLYVNRDHPSYSYNYSGSWQLNKFWRSQTYASDLQLVSYGSNITLIKKASVDDTGVAIKIDSGLTYPIREPKELIKNFEFDETLRVVYKVTETSRIRIDNVKQSMLCPLHNKILLEDDYIDGFNNNLLLHTKTILNVTMKRSFAASMKDIIKLLSTRLPTINMKPVFTTFARICMSIDKSITAKIEDIAEVIEYETFDIEGEFPSSFLQEHYLTEPEDLDAIELECLYDEAERIGAIIKHNSLLRLFCRYITPKLPDYDIESLLWLLIKDRTFSKILIDNINNIRNEIFDLETLVDIGGESDLEIDLYSFIVSNELDRLETYQSIDFQKLINIKDKLIDNLEVYKWYRKYNNYIINLLTEEETDPSLQLLKYL